MFQFAPRYDSTTCGSLTTRSASALADDPADVERDDPVGHRHDEREVVLDHEQAGAGEVAETEQAPARALRSRVARSRPRARRAGSPRGCAPIWHARSTMRRLPVERSATNLSRNSPSPIVSMSSSARRPSRRSERATLGTRSAAVTGSQSASCVVERDAQRLVDGERAEEPRVLERARQAQAGACRRAQAAPRRWPPSQDASVGRERGSPRPRRRAWSCPRRSVRSARGSRPSCSSIVTSSSAMTPAKRLA